MTRLLIAAMVIAMDNLQLAALAVGILVAGAIAAKGVWWLAGYIIATAAKLMGLG